MKTVILFRHADIDVPTGPAPDDWPLNAAGRARAAELAHVLGSAGVTAVFASPADRTQQTVAPLLAALGLPLRVPGPPALVPEILSSGAGAVVVVAGHSNTVPTIIAGLGGPASVPVLTGHADLFVVTVIGPNEARLVHLRYGAPSP